MSCTGHMTEPTPALEEVRSRKGDTQPGKCGPGPTVPGKFPVPYTIKTDTYRCTHLRSHPLRTLGYSEGKAITKS